MSEQTSNYKSFIHSPWQPQHQHAAYKDSFLSFSNAPEYAAPEVLLASLYRQIGLMEGEGTQSKRLSESDVGKKGTELRKLIDKQRKTGKSLGLLSAEGWERLITEIIRSPRQPNQKSKRSLQITPITPSCAAFSMASRLKSNPWNPGALIESCIVQGSESEAEANATLQELFKALSVTERDDVFAIFLEQEFQKWSPFEISWSFSKKLAKNEWIKDWHKSGIKLPAQRFAKDINHIIEAKDVLTRRQWTSILEACLRIGLGSHSLWVSKCNEVLFKITEQVMAGVDVPSSDDIRDQLNTGKGFWAYEQPIGGHNKKLIRGYLYGRIGLNFLLHFCTEKGLTDSKQRPFNSPNDIHDFLKQLKSRTDEQFKSEFRLALDTVLELEPRKLSAKQGIGKNLEEFLRHSMGQRETNERGLENYDQGYVFSRRGAYARAPWILSCGPVLILTLTYCCSCDGTGVRTVKDLCHHLSEYGIKISPDEVSKSKLGISLRTLGLVLDSPDAEGGMVIINPFQTGR